ncbi:MAG: VCBS repeat-containing protein, partial [Nitrosomonas sp. PRO4]|nr:VCBS repeat-containing protein [Nitrosomonas sp. PRO4]
MGWLNHNNLQCSLKKTIHVLCMFFFLNLHLQAAEEPIAKIGHGAFFDHSGKQIPLTLEFVAKAQEWYKAKFLSDLSSEKQLDFSILESKFNSENKSMDQTSLTVQQYSLEWMLMNSRLLSSDFRMIGKMRALKNALLWKIPDNTENSGNFVKEKFKLDSSIENKLKIFSESNMQLLGYTSNRGQGYIDECKAAGVPIPPPIGVMDPEGLNGWKSQGFIPKDIQFIVGTPAEFRTYQSSSPAGMCVALPRYSDDSKTTVALDGVICLGESSSKACFWDNQMNGVGFSFQAGTIIPIGIPDLTVNSAGLYQAGGKELEGGTGGVCTDCHQGKNPFIIHPNANLGNKFMGELSSILPTFSRAYYEPIVPQSWSRNKPSISSADRVPSGCAGCHSSNGVAGAFPQLSIDTRGYCDIILKQAINTTMPPSSPGSLASTVEMQDFLKLCDQPAGKFQNFNVETFSPWSGYSIPNGLWLPGDINGDGKTDIVHAVQGSDYVHTWLSNGDGTFTVGTFSPWSGYSIPNGLWLPGDINGDGKTDIV